MLVVDVPLHTCILNPFFTVIIWALLLALFITLYLMVFRLPCWTNWSHFLSTVAFQVAFEVRLGHSLTTFVAIHLLILLAFLAAWLDVILHPWIWKCHVTTFLAGLSKTMHIQFVQFKGFSWLSLKYAFSLITLEDLEQLTFAHNMLHVALILL